MSKYSELMERVKLNDDMKSRILSDVEKKNKAKNRNRLIQYSTVIASLAAVIVLAIIAPWDKTSRTPLGNASTEEVTLDGLGQTATTENQGGESDLVQIANPWVDAKDASEAESLSGMTFSIPASFEGYPEVRYSVMNAGNIISQVVFAGENGEIRIRKAKGEDDISGDYNFYNVDKTIEVNDIKINLKGSGGKINLATWNAAGYTYSFSCDGGFEEEAVLDYINQIK